MKKKLWVCGMLMVMAMTLLCLTTAALADWEKYEGYELEEFNTWFAQAKEAAKSADHILGPSDIDTIQARSLTIILPGDTIAVVPDASYNYDAVQGGIDKFGFEIIQLNDPVVNTEFLYEGHSPEKTTFTEVESATIKMVYGSSTYINGTKQVEYVSLYRNDTGYPVVLRGHHSGSASNVYTKSGDSYSGSGSEDQRTTDVQIGGDIRYAPMFYFVEPTYQLTVWMKAGDGRAYEWPVSDPVTTLTIYMDRSDHTYELDNPALPGRQFKNWRRVTNTFAFPIDTEGTITGNKTAYTFNMQKLLYEKADSTGGHLKYYASDGELAVEWNNGKTVRFHAGNGTINGLDTLLVEVGSSFKMDEHKATWSGHTFGGWGKSESDPAGTLLTGATADNVSSWFSGSNDNMDVYASWGVTQHTIRFDAGGGTGSMNSLTVDTGTRYTLPANGFTAPAGKEFDAWDVGAVGSQIEITADTVIKALWKDIPVQTYTISFDAGGGTGTMANITVEEGAKYTLPVNGFTAPAGKVFDAWDAGAAGSVIEIIKDTVVKALWRDQAEEPAQPETVIYTCVEGSGGSWEKESSGALRFVFKRNVEDELTYSRFTKIQVDGKDVDESNYTKASGSVIITLKQTYLNTLSTGTHTLSAYFADSSQAAKADASFTVRGKAEEYVVPQTGDEEPLLLWTLISLVGLCLVLGGLWAGKQGRFHR